MSTEMQTKVQASPAQNFTPVQTGLLQRKCTLCNTPGLVEDSGRDKEKLTLQRSSVDQAGTTMVPRFGHDFSRVRVHSTGQEMIQTKLKINEPGDIYEQEADRVADAVMRMPEPGVQREVEPEEEELEEDKEEETLQTKTIAGTITPVIQRHPTEEEEKLQAKTTPSHTPKGNSITYACIQSLRSGGQPLRQRERDFFETRFGWDFGHVRIHTDSQAAKAAKRVKAQAFTYGKDIVFGARQYSPETLSGKTLLSHELTHVVQQQSGAYFGLQKAPTNPQTPAKSINWAADPMQWNYKKLQNALDCLGRVRAFYHFFFKNLGRYRVWQIINFIVIRSKKYPSISPFNLQTVSTIYKRLRKLNSMSPPPGIRELEAVDQFISLAKKINVLTPKYFSRRRRKYYRLSYLLAGSPAPAKKKKLYFLGAGKSIKRILMILFDRGRLRAIQALWKTLMTKYSKQGIAGYSAYWSSYIKALKQTSDPRRAGIAYQKLLVTMNVLDREKSIEGSMGKGLSLLRQMHKVVLKALKTGLSKKIYFGVGRATAKTYHRAGGITKHIRGGRKKSFLRQGWRHRYGALDIFAGKGASAPINVKFRHIVKPDEFPDVNDLPSVKASKSPINFSLVYGVITNIDKTSTWADIGYRFLKAFEISYHKIKEEKPGWAWRRIAGTRKYRRRFVQYKIKKIEGIKTSYGALRNLWSALYFVETSKHSLPAAIDNKLKSAVINLRAVLAPIESLAFSRSIPGSSPGQSGKHGTVKLSSGYPKGYRGGFGAWQKHMKYIVKLFQQKELMRKRRKYWVNRYRKQKLKFLKRHFLRSLTKYYIKQGHKTYIARRKAIADLNRIALAYAKGRAMGRVRPLPRRERHDLAKIIRELNKSFRGAIGPLKDIVSILKDKKSYDSSNKVSIRLNYTGGNFTLKGLMSFGHLYAVQLAIPGKNRPVKEGDRFSDTLKVGLLGSTGKSVSPHIHLSANFKLIRKLPQQAMSIKSSRTRGKRSSGNVLIIEPCSPLVFLADKL